MTRDDTASNDSGAVYPAMRPRMIVGLGREDQRADALSWRAVDHEGEVLESYVTKTHDKQAALRFMKKALTRHGTPETITTNGLRSYGAAMSKFGNAEKREVGRHANNRV